MAMLTADLPTILQLWRRTPCGMGEQICYCKAWFDLKLLAHGELQTNHGPYCSLPVPEGAYKKAGEGLLTRASSDRTRANGFKLKEGRFKLDIWKKFFTLRVVRHWPRLHREAVAVPSLALFKARLDGALSNLVWWKVSLPMTGGLEQDDLSCPFQLIPFNDSMIQ